MWYALIVNIIIQQLLTMAPEITTNVSFLLIKHSIFSNMHFVVEQKQSLS